MPHLFPGIDPFLEAQGFWPDFHARTIAYSSDAIADLLPAAYSIRIEERIHLVERSSMDVRLMRPDLALERSSGFLSGGRTPALLEREPTTIPLPLIEEVRETYLEIIHRPDQTLVAVIEILSPDNKAGPGFGQYLVKRSALLRGLVHLVEFDFLVGGHRLPMARPLPAGDTYAFVARGDRRPDCEVYAWSVRQPLSTIRIPLLAPDPDLLLDLAAVYDMTFEKGRYARSIDYHAPLVVGLAPEDRAWAEARAKRIET